MRFILRLSCCLLHLSFSVSGLKPSLNDSGLSLRIHNAPGHAGHSCRIYPQPALEKCGMILHLHSLFSWMAIQRAHGNDRYSSIRRGGRLCGLQVGETGVGGGSRHSRKYVGNFGHQQQEQRTQAFAPRPHVGAEQRGCQKLIPKQLRYTTPSPWR